MFVRKGVENADIDADAVVERSHTLGESVKA